jgi:hypothetical protein
VPDRIEVIQKFIDARKAATYLEIGVNTGACFLKIRAPYKIGVDPNFIIPWGRRIKYFVKNPSNFNNRYHETTSDAFFEANGELLRERPPEVAFVDGLHTHEQSLQDVRNILKFMREDGVIVMHDCSPPHAAAAVRAGSYEEAKAMSPPGWTGAWCGDVWKTIVYLRAMHEDLDVMVLDCDRGLGIVRKGRAQSALPFSPQDIAGLSYPDLEANRREWLNLKPPEHLQELLRGLKR